MALFYFLKIHFQHLRTKRWIDCLNLSIKIKHPFSCVHVTYICFKFCYMHNGKKKKIECHKHCELNLRGWAIMITRDKCYKHNLTNFRARHTCTYHPYINNTDYSIIIYWFNTIIWWGKLYLFEQNEMFVGCKKKTEKEYHKCQKTVKLN